jgi:predicted anti-sigma-YlaC factor YlaD
MNESRVELSCKEAARLMSRRQDMQLTSLEQENLKEHLYQCLSCRRFEEQLGFLRKLAARYAQGDG